MRDRQAVVHAQAMPGGRSPADGSVSDRIDTMQGHTLPVIGVIEPPGIELEGIVEMDLHRLPGEIAGQIGFCLQDPVVETFPQAERVCPDLNSAIVRCHIQVRTAVLVQVVPAGEADPRIQHQPDGAPQDGIPEMHLPGQLQIFAPGRDPVGMVVTRVLHT